MKSNSANPALLLIDLQKGFDDQAHWGGNRNNPKAEEKILSILNKWRKLHLPIYHVIHSSLDPNSKLHESDSGFEIKNEFKPADGETLIVKHVNSAFIGTDLKERLDKEGINDLVVVGLTTNHCVSTTVRMAGNLGFKVLLISDATASFDRLGLNGERFDSELIHQTALASLNKEFAEVIDSKELLNREIV